ncbi:MAG TPA: GTPase HflX [Saprospiraceae bacterium]|nr:GTPase HflX [Saprospiraceae bacterium]MCC6689013.1 GTPase HflX [Saprospiraceae bacterium]HMW75133.1 GTPase HflX [Saprospiraceae bacterium]HMX81807.1 GTPase HflX [Saprospiraceae bacterium]HMX84870.1 GTPase HflX [Saprospiraceae bacterium]
MSKDWNTGKHQQSNLKKEDEKAVLVGLVTQHQSDEKVQEYLDELEFLALTAGAVTTKRFVQKLERPDTRYFVGKGKMEEIARYVDEHQIDLVIFDDDLSGKQQHLIEEVLKIKVVDRSTLILDIFASRAQTAQAKTQVELAQLQYLLPRLRGMWTHLERQRGGIGMRGPGEKEIETDRRIVRDIISGLKKDLEKIERQAHTQRKTRGEMIRVALVGYTNVGKSTLMNLLSKSEVFAENKLFATLDTTVRKVVFGTMPFLLSDTVGFIRKLPHHLVESFKSTLDEVRESDILLHLVDFSHPQYEDHIATVNQTLQDIDCRDKPTLLVFNKIDAYRERNFDEMLDAETKANIEQELTENLRNKYDSDAILISAITGENIPTLKDKIAEMVEKQYMIRYPYKTNNW